MTVLCGVVYPLLVNAIAQLTFPEKANGSLVVVGGKVVGSELIGQKFDSAFYFQSRPSAVDYNPLPSGGSNLGPSSAKLKELVTTRREQWSKLNPASSNEEIPSEMLFASGSGLDPHISLRSANLQVERIAQVRKLDDAQLQQLLKLIGGLTEKPQFTLLGEGRINVLKLNLALDQLTKSDNH